MEGCLKYILAAILQVCLFSSGQTQIKVISLENLDSLRKLLPDVTGNSRIDCLNNLSFLSILLSTRDSAIYVTNISVREAENAEYIPGIARAYANKALLSEWLFDDYMNEEKFARESLHWYSKTSDKNGIAIAYCRLGSALIAQGYYSEAIGYLDTSFTRFSENKIEWGMQGCLTFLTSAYKQMGNYEKAFELSRQSHQWAMQTGDKDAIMEGLWNIGELYTAIEDYPTALSYFRNIYYQPPNRINSCFAFRMQFAELFSLQHEYDSALYYYNMFSKLRLQDKDVPQLLFSKGKYFLLLKEYDSALSYFKQALIYHKRLNHQAMVMQTLIQLARVNLALKQHEIALRYAESALALARNKNARQVIRDASQIIADVFETREQHDSAFLYYKQYIAAKDKILTDQVKGKIAAFGPEQKVELLNKEKEIQQAKLQRQSALNNMFILSFLLLSTLSVIAFRYIMLKRKNEKHRRELAENELRLQKFENEKSRTELEKHAAELEMQALRAQMNPHFIFNCLSSINRYILMNESERASDYLTKFSRLIRMVLTSSKNSLISLDDELEMLRLYLEMERLRFNFSFNYDIVFQNEIDPENIFIPPLLLQPFAENAIWHGLMHKKGQGHLEIKFSTDGKVLTAFIVDDGIGRLKAEIINNKSQREKKSMGLQITSERLALLNRDINMESFFRIEDITDDDGNCRGTKVILRMKYKELSEIFN